MISLSKIDEHALDSCPFRLLGHILAHYETQLHCSGI
uniref:Uncharacterized protein n=1 Tax=Rhizophora mucronata TaxID=61149 RepID=A0A2P2IIS6_RHIMU